MPRAKREDGINARTVASNKYQKNNYDRTSIVIRDSIPSISDGCKK